MPLENFDAILIAGPTASGKSAHAMKLAAKHDGIIINADSMQVYKDLTILTARPTPSEETACPHRLYGFVPSTQAYSAGQWAEDVKALLQECKHLQKMPILVGGTGLYFSTLLQGLSPIPDIPSDIRNHWRAQADKQSAPELHNILIQKDPIMAERLRPSDPQRIVRALEVIDATGQSLADWQAIPGTPLIEEAKTLRYVLAPDRETLYQRCNARFDQMVANGALEEVENLKQQNLDPGLPIMRVLGLRPLIEYLEQTISRETALDFAKRDTRRYAKRQLTWLKSNMITWNWINK